jgi:hypothetical protein
MWEWEREREHTTPLEPLWSCILFPIPSPVTFQLAFHVTTPRMHAWLRWLNGPLQSLQFFWFYLPCLGSERGREDTHATTRTIVLMHSLSHPFSSEQHLATSPRWTTDIPISKSLCTRLTTFSHCKIILKTLGKYSLQISPWALEKYRCSPCKCTFLSLIIFFQFFSF